MQRQPRSARYWEHEQPTATRTEELEVRLYHQAEVLQFCDVRRSRTTGEVTWPRVFGVYASRVADTQEGIALIEQFLRMVKAERDRRLRKFHSNVPE